MAVTFKIRIMYNDPETYELRFDAPIYRETFTDAVTTLCDAIDNHDGLDAKGDFTPIGSERDCSWWRTFNAFAYGYLQGVTRKTTAKTRELLASGTLREKIRPSNKTGN